MAKEKELAEVLDAPVAPVKDSRQARWEAFLAAHKAQNPLKHEARLKAGELNKIPDSF